MKCSLAALWLLGVGAPGLAGAHGPSEPQAPDDPVHPREIDNPYRVDADGPLHLDLSPEAVAARRAEPQPPPPIPFSELDHYRLEREPTADPEALASRPGLPEGWVQIGDEVVPEAVAAGAQVRSGPVAPGPQALSAGDSEPQTSLIDELCTFPEDVPPFIYQGKWKPGEEYPRRGTIYLNYLGGVLYNGNGENSAENYSTLALSGHMYPVFGGGNDRAIAVAQNVQADFADWALRVVYLERPNKTIPYVMTMVGGHYSDTVAGPSGGVAPSADCEDVGMRNVCYSFTNLQHINTQANIIGQEVGHTYGLGHTYGSDRIMAYGYATGGTADMIFGDDCTAVYIAPDQPGPCGGVNRCHCGDPNEQHDNRTISAIYAPPGPDLVPPTIAILTPENGAVFPSGASVDVTVDPWDDYGGYGWKVMVFQEGELLGEKYDYPRVQEFALNGLPDGTYEVVAEIEDQADNIVQERITVHVGVDGGESESGGESEGSETEGSETEGGETSGETVGGTSESGESGGETGGESSGFDDDLDGCSCGVDGDLGSRRGAPTYLLGCGLGFLLVAPRARRRRG